MRGRLRPPIFALAFGVVVATATYGAGATSGRPRTIPESILAVMDKPRYEGSTWSLVVTDVETGETFYELHPKRLSFTGSTRKLFSVGLALNTLGADHRELTPVHRVGDVDAAGVLHGDLVLVAGGDLTFGGRRIGADTVRYTNFDHNDANSLGSAVLTAQDPLFALDELAGQVAAAGIRSVSGDVVVDDRLFEPYRVPNGNLLITPMMVNENMIDVTITPSAAGKPATMRYRPETAAFTVDGQVATENAGSAADIELSGDGLIECIGKPGCGGEVSGTLPARYEAPLTHRDSFVGTFRVEDPASFARVTFIEALQRRGVTVTAPLLAPNPTAVLGPTSDYSPDTVVASYESAPFAQQARLVLKVSLNLGANLSLSLFGLAKSARTIEDALAAERATLETEFGIDGDQFDFPTNGSGTPDSRATPRALVRFLDEMADTRVAGEYRDALPVLGENGSLATSGRDLPGRGHVFAKPGTTIAPGAGGTVELKAQNLAGYIETKRGRTVAYALMLNDAGPVTDIASDVGAVFQDEARISSIIFERL